MLWSKVFSSQSICIFSYFCSLWTDLGQKLCRSWMAKFYHVHKYSLCPIRHWRWWRVPLKALTINPHFMKLIRKGTWSSFFFFPFFLVRLGLSHFLNSIDLFPFAFVLLRLSRQACGSNLGLLAILPLNCFPFPDSSRSFFSPTVTYFYYFLFPSFFSVFLYFILYISSFYLTHSFSL